MIEPTVRFPEFKGSWNNYKIEDMFDRVGTPVDLDDTQTYREIGIRSHGKGIFHKEETTATEIGNKRVFWIEPDCFVVNIVFAWERAVAKTTEKENGMIASHRFPMYKPKKNIVDLDYITEYFITKRGQNVLILASPGGAGRNKTLGQKEFAKSVVKLPSLPEQQKIAEFLSTIDTVIEKKKETVSAWEERKKGVMQKLFSQEVRFKANDGSEFPDWEKKKIGDVFDVTRGYVLPVKKTREVSDNEYKYPVYSSQTKNNGLMGFYNQKLYENAITWTTDGANAGKTVYRNEEFYCTNVCGVLLDKNGNHNANDCIANMIDTISKKYVSYVGNPKLMNNVMSEIEIDFPCPEEQQKIADCLSSLDEVIEKQKATLAAWEELKKGLLQQMFV